MPTYTFGTSVNPGYFTEIPDADYVDPNGNTTKTKRPAAGTQLLVKDAATGTDLPAISTTEFGYWTYTADVPEILISGDDGETWVGPISAGSGGGDGYTMTEADARFAPISVPPSSLAATGTPSSTTYLRGDGTWATPASGSGSVSSDSITDATTTGKALIKATSGSVARTAIGAAAATAVPSFDTTVTPAGGDVWTYDDEAGTFVPLPPNLPPNDTFAIRGATVNPGDAVPANFPVGGWLAVRSSAPVLGASILGQNGSATSGTSVTVALTGAVSTSEDILVAITAAAPGTVLSTITITDAASTSYALRGQRLQGSTVQTQVFKGRPPSAIGASSSLTVTFGAAVGDIEVVVIKLTGLITSSFDQGGVNSALNASTLALATGAPTSQANELAVIAQGFNGSGNAAVAPAGWTQVGTTQTSGGTNPKFCAVFVKQLTAAGTVGASVGTTAAGVIVGVLDTFKAA